MGQATLDRLRVPDESPTFFEDLWEAAQARERAAARRWRRTSLVLAVVAALAISTAAVLGAAARGRRRHGAAPHRPELGARPPLPRHRALRLPDPDARLDGWSVAACE